MSVIYGRGFSVYNLSPAIWLDAADSTTLYDSTSGGNLVLSGGQVARWEDKSGNRRHAISSSTAKPVRDVGYLNNKDGLLFTVSKTNLAISANNTTYSQYSIFTAFRPTSYPGESTGWNMATIIGSGHSGSSNDYQIGIGNNTSINQGIYYSEPAGTLRNTTSNMVINTPYIMSLKASGGTGQLRVNGGNVATGVATAALSLIDTFVGSHPNYGSQFPGHIFEIIMFLNNITDGQRKAVEIYLSNKWGIPLTT